MSDSLPVSASLPLLLPEALGFSPQLLLDDIINVTNNAVQDGVNGMEEFLQNWTDKRIALSPSVEMESIQEVEQGLVAFQTLLEYHTDIAFDLFEAWSLRNIFAVPPDLDVVLPHHEGLNLSSDRTQAEQREKELADEIEELRNKIDNVRYCYFPAIAPLIIESASNNWPSGNLKAQCVYLLLGVGALSNASATFYHVCLRR